MKKQIAQKIDDSSRLDLVDLIISIIGVVFFTTVFVYGLVAQGQYNQWRFYISFFLNLISILNLIFTIKKRVINVYFGLVWAILNGVIAITQGFIANAVRYFAINTTMQIITLIVWMKKSTNHKTVKTSNSSPKFFWIAMAITIAVTALLTFFETQPWFMNFLQMEVLEWYRALPDVIAFVFSLTAAIFFIKRRNEYWIFTYVTSIAGFVLWISTLCINPTDFVTIEMFGGACIDLLFCTKGLLEWYNWLPKIKKVL